MVKCPEDWDIYSSMAGSDLANEAITRAVSRVVQEMRTAGKENDIGPKMVMRLVEEHVVPVFDKYQKYGTYDTEPRATVAWYLSKMAAELGSEAEESIYEAVRWEL